MGNTFCTLVVAVSLASLASAQQRDASRLAPCPADPELTRALDSLRAQDPVRDARAAAERGDYRFWAVQGYVTQVPAVGGTLREIERGGGYRVFDRTSVAINSFECRRADGGIVTDSTHALWNKVAYAYAEAYNRELRRRR
jgi:hypothetical protein